MLVRHIVWTTVAYPARELVGSRVRVVAMVVVGALALACARVAAGSAPVHPTHCKAQYPIPYPVPYPLQPPTPRGHTAAARLQSLIDDVPCPGTGRVSFATHDNHGDAMSVLDPIPGPDGGYLGVYHSSFPPFGQFKICLAVSRDLIHWTRVEILDGQGASMPTLRTIAGAPGYLLAYEKVRAGGNVVRLRYYPSPAALMANRFSAERDLPRVFSPYNNGTPTILWVRWNGALNRSVIELGFHYETAPAGARGPDREAIGTLRGFRTWSAWSDTAVDAAIDRRGLLGSHGDWRQFYFEHDRWRVYEAQTAFDDFGTWRVLLEDPRSGRLYPLKLTMAGLPVASSFANPVARIEPAPTGGGRVLVITTFVFAARGSGLPGELVYYQPV